MPVSWKPWLLLAFAGGSLNLAALAGAQPPTAAGGEPPAGDRSLAGSPAPLFRDGTAATGLDAVHDNGAAGRLELLAIMGPGAALLDHDLDGDLDLYLPRGGRLPADPAPEGAAAPAGRLLRNDLAPGAGGVVAPRWLDVTAAAGLTAPGYAMGAATGDVDGDGDTDLFVPLLGRDQLWRNDGDGTFSDASAALAEPTAAGSWSIAGSFFDADGDGDLDLYVVRYVTPTPGVRCVAESTRPDYCGPAAYPPLPDRLLRNRGDGTFDDASVASGIGRVAAPGLGVIAGDFDRDGRVDLYVANDGQPNFLWRNRGDGSFEDDGPLSGTAVSREGLAQAGMGVDAADADGDLDEDLFVTNLTGETNTLYEAVAPGVFSDRTAARGLASPSLPWTGFGTGFVDADLDGQLDLVVVNGAVRLAQVAPAAGGEAAGLAQPAQLYRNDGGRFTSASPAVAGEALTAPAVRRGLALGDVDGDGDEDAVVAVNGGAARLLLAEPPAAARWAAVAGCPGGASAPWLARQVIARPAVAAAGGTGGARWLRRPRADGSFASARESRALIGLGGAGHVDLELVGARPQLRWLRAPAGKTLRWCPPEEPR